MLVRNITFCKLQTFTNICLLSHKLYHSVEVITKKDLFEREQEKLILQLEVVAIY
uniref:Uncharacterized protein n=1 Tax=Arion vulgaris TaxID=1028688 RepID=A0A0B7B376_9EUPU